MVFLHHNTFVTTGVGMFSGAKNSSVGKLLRGGRGGGAGDGGGGKGEDAGKGQAW